MFLCIAADVDPLECSAKMSCDRCVFVLHLLSFVEFLFSARNRFCLLWSKTPLSATKISEVPPPSGYLYYRTCVEQPLLGWSFETGGLSIQIIDTGLTEEPNLC